MTDAERDFLARWDNVPPLTNRSGLYPWRDQQEAERLRHEEAIARAKREQANVKAQASRRQRALEIAARLRKMRTK